AIDVIVVLAEQRRAAFHLRAVGADPPGRADNRPAAVLVIADHAISLAAPEIAVRAQVDRTHALEGGHASLAQPLGQFAGVARPSKLADRGVERVAVFQP